MAEAVPNPDEVVERIEIAAPIETVFAAISDPGKIMDWWEEPGVSKIESWEQDFVVGGRSSPGQRSPAGQSTSQRQRPMWRESE